MSDYSRKIIQRLLKVAEMSSSDKANLMKEFLNSIDPNIYDSLSADVSNIQNFTAPTQLISQVGRNTGMTALKRNDAEKIVRVEIDKALLKKDQDLKGEEILKDAIGCVQSVVDAALKIVEENSPQIESEDQELTDQQDWEINHIPLALERKQNDLLSVEKKGVALASTPKLMKIVKDTEKLLRESENYSEFASNIDYSQCNQKIKALQGVQEKLKGMNEKVMASLLSLDPKERGKVKDIFSEQELKKIEEDIQKNAEYKTLLKEWEEEENAQRSLIIVQDKDVFLEELYNSLLKSGMAKLFGKGMSMMGPEDIEQVLNLYLMNINPTGFIEGMVGNTQGTSADYQLTNVFADRAGESFKDGWDGQYSFTSIQSAFGNVMKRLNQRIKNKLRQEGINPEYAYDPLSGDEDRVSELDRATEKARGGTGHKHLNLKSWQSIVSAASFNPAMERVANKLLALITDNAAGLANAAVEIGMEGDPLIKVAFRLGVARGVLKDPLSEYCEAFMGTGIKISDSLPSSVPPPFKGGKFKRAMAFQVFSIMFPKYKDLYVLQRGVMPPALAGESSFKWPPKEPICPTVDQLRGAYQPFRRYPYNMPKGMEITKAEIDISWASNNAFLKKALTNFVNRIVTCKVGGQKIHYVMFEDFTTGNPKLGGQTAYGLMGKVNAQFKNKFKYVLMGGGLTKFEKAFEYILGEVNIDTDKHINDWIAPKPLPNTIGDTEKTFILSFQDDFLDVLKELADASALYEDQMKLGSKKETKKFAALVQRVAFLWLMREATRP